MVLINGTGLQYILVKIYRIACSVFKCIRSRVV
jgi:hypothetical protein